MADSLTITPTSDRVATNILCFETLANNASSQEDTCTRVSALFSNVTIVRTTDEFPADLSAFDVVITNTRETTLLDTFASQLNEFAEMGGGLIVSQPTFTSGTQPFPPGFELTVTDHVWPGFPLGAPPAVQFTSAGAAHPILDGLTPDALAGNTMVIPISTLGSAWILLAQSVDDPHAGLAVGEYGLGRLIVLAVGGSAHADGDQFVQQMVEWAAQGSMPTPPSGPDMQIDAIEVTQAIQDLNNSVDLIANKRTYVRVHVSISASETLSVPETVSSVVANLEVMRDGAPLSPTLIPGNPGGDIMIDANRDRGQIDDSFWFEIPTEWVDAGTVMFTATVDPNNTKNDPDRSNNQESVTVEFLAAPPLPLQLYNVQYAIDGTTYQADDFHLDRAESWLRRAYPISELNGKRRSFIYPEDGLPKTDRLFLWLGIARRLSILLSIDSADTYYYGMVGDDGGTLPAGIAESIPGRVAIGPAGPTGPNAPLFTRWDRDGSYGDYLVGHEVAHLIGRFHADFCGVGAINFAAPYPHRLGRISPTTRGDQAIYGFDIESRKIYGPNWKDVMTYCDFRWVSDFTYEGIRQEMAAASAANVDTVDAEKFLMVSAIISDSADLTTPAVELLDIQLIEQAGTLSLPQPGDWTIALLDAINNVLATYPVALRGVDGDSPAAISEVVPWVEGTSKIELRNGSQIVAQKSASANAPSVTIITPSQSEIFGNGPIQFDWMGNDADQDSLTYSVLYRHAVDTEWEVLTTGLATPSLVIDASLLPGGSASYLRIIASDGFLTGAETVGPFTVPAGQPVPTIEAPLADGVPYYTGQLVPFRGSGYDLEDGQMDSAALTWTSSIDGDLGTGATIHRFDLSAGDHTITLTATDSDGNTGRAQRTVSILADAEAEPDHLSVAPFAHIVTAQIGDTSTFSTTFTVRNSGESALDWTVQKDAEWVTLGASSGATPAELIVTVDATQLTPGTHQAAITFMAENVANSPLIVPIQVEVHQISQDSTMRLYLPLVSK